MVKASRYNWSLLYNSDIRNTITVRNNFNTLQETFERHVPNDDYVNFVTVHLEAAIEYITRKSRASNRFSWDSIVIQEKRENRKNHSD